MANEKILIVEDERIVALDIKESLKKMGYSVCGLVSSGEDAIKKAEKTRPDLVLMDIKLKGKIDGIEAAGKIRERLDVPIIYLTAYADEKTLKRAKVTEPFGYITKPFTDKDLQSNIEISLYRSEMGRKLKDSEQKFRSVFDNANIMIFGTDKNGTIEYINKNAEEILEYSPGEALGMNNMLLHPPEQRKEILEKFKVHVSGKLKDNLELMYITKSGKRLVGSMAQATFIDRTGKEWYFGLVQNITDSKKAEEALRESEELHRITLSNISDAVFITDNTGEFTYICPNVNIIFGYSFDEVQGFSNIAKILGGNHFNRNDLETLGEIQNIDWEITDKAGRVHNLLVNVKAVSIKGGTILYTCRDFTERKRGEEKLRQFEHIVSSSTDMMALLDTTFTYLAANKSYLEAFKMAPDEIIGRTPSEVFGEKFFNTVIKPHANKCLEGEEVQYEDSFNFPVYGPRYMEINYYPYKNDDGEIIGFVVNGRDITERKQAEEKLRQYQDHLSEMVESKAQELSLLQSVNSQLNSGAEPEVVYEVIAEGLASIFHYHSSGIYILDEEGEHLICKGYHTDSKIAKKIEKLTGVKALNLSIPLLKKGILAKIVETREHVITRDIEGVVRAHSDKRAIRALSKTIAKASGAKWGLGVPLLAGERIVGILGVGSPNELRDEDASRLAYFGDQVGLALEKSRMNTVLEEKVVERTKEIKKLKDFNESIVQGMDEGILVLDSNGRVTFFNPRCGKMLEYTDKELIGAHWMKLLPKGLHREIEKKSREWSKGETAKFESTMITKDGREVPVIISATPLSEEGALGGSLLVLTDITEVKAKERNLLKRKRVYDVSNGEVYLVKDSGGAKAIDVYQDIMASGYSGLVITRRRPESLKERLSENSKVFWMSGTGAEDTVLPKIIDLMLLIRAHLLRDTVVFLDRFEYLILQRGFRESMVFIHDLVDLFYKSEAILVVSLDPRTLSDEQLAILEEETKEVKLRTTISMSEGGVEFLKYVLEQNNDGRKPSISDVIKGLDLSKPTVIKRGRILRDNGLIKESKVGRRKLLEVTEKGRRVL